jgi:hypothetical protein
VNYIPKYRPIPFIAFSLFMLTNCVNTVTESAPWNITPVPVVYSVISPGLFVQVYLGKTINTNLQDESKPFSEARVFLCDADSIWVELSRQSVDTAIYKDTGKKILVEKGKTYSLRVELSDRVLHAQTTVPDQYGTINDVKCIDIGSSGGSMSINGVLVRGNMCWLTVKYNLPDNKEYGNYLSAFSNEIGNSPTLTTGTYLDDYFLSPQDSTSFILSMVTTDKTLTKFRLSKYISPYLLSSGGVETIIELYGGVLPNFSNIENGTGIFGSYVLVNKRVEVSKLN